MAEVDLNITADADKAVRELRRTSGGADQLAKRSSRATGALKNLGVGAIAAAGGLAALGGAAAVALGKASSQAQELSDHLDNLSTQTGLSTENLQVLTVAAADSGASLEVVASGMGALQKRIIEGTATARIAVGKLGLSFDELKTQSPDEQLDLVLARLNEMPNATERAAAAAALFGRGAGQAILGVAAGMDEARERAERLGIVLSGETVAASDRMEQAFSDLGKAGEGFVNQLGGAINTSPELQRVVTSLTGEIANLNKWVAANQDTIARWVEFGIAGAGEGVGLFIDVLSNLIEAYALVQKGTDKVAEGFAVAWLKATGKSDQFIADFVASWEFQSEKFQAGLDDLSGGAEGLADKLRELGSGMESDVLPELEAADGRAREAAAGMGELNDEIAKIAIAQREFAGLELVPPGAADNIAIVGAEYENLRLVLPGIAKDVRDVGDETQSAADTNLDFAQSIQQAANFVRLFDNDLGSIVGQLGALRGGIQALQQGGGISGIFGEAFDAAGGGPLGAIAGVANLAGPIGAIAGPVASALQGVFGGPDVEGVMRDAARDLGTQISEDLARRIAEKDEPVALSLAEIIREGSIEVDRAFQEVGDLFSFIEQGGDRAAAIRTIEESVALLLPRLGEMGERGQAEVERIIAAAGRLGVEFKGLDELINSTFATDTVEEMAAQFELTNQEVRELAKELGVNVQTNLERAAAQANLTVEEFRKLQQEIGERLGKEGPATIEEVTRLLDAMGLSAEDAATQLGVGVGEGAAGAAEGTKKAADNLEIAANQARRLFENLAAAARESASINPNVGGGGGGGGGAPGFQHGTPNLDFANFGMGTLATLHGTEAIIPRGGGNRLAQEIAAALGSKTLNINLNISSRGLEGGASAAMREQLTSIMSQVVRQAIRNGELNSNDFVQVV